MKRIFVLVSRIGICILLVLSTFSIVPAQRTIGKITDVSPHINIINEKAVTLKLPSFAKLCFFIAGILFFFAFLDILYQNL